MRTRPRMGLDIGYTYHCVGYVNHQVVYNYEMSMAKFEYTFKTVEIWPLQKNVCVSSRPKNGLIWKIDLLAILGQHSKF